MNADAAARRPKGQGSITPAKDGRWRVRYTIPATTDRPAKRISRLTKGRSRREAEDLLRDLRSRHAEAPAAQAEEMLPRPRLRLDTFTRSVWAPALADSGVRARTAEEYRRVAERYVLPALGHRRCSELRASDAVALTARIREQGLAPATVRRAAQVLVLIMREAERHTVLPTGTADTVVLPSGRRAKEPPRLTPENIEAVLDIVLTDCSAPEPPAAALAALLVVTLGVRRGEACGARRDALDPEAGTLRITESVTELADGTLVTGQPPKTDNGIRLLALDPRVLAALMAESRRRPFGTYLAEPSRAALGTPVRPTALSRYLRAAVRRAGVPGRGGAHEFRRGITDALLDGGVDALTASRWLGHGSARLVQEVYAGGREQAVLDAAAVLPFRAAGA